MRLSLYIAKRYLLSKKSHQVINLISGVAVAGVALATIAMICTLSVFNGFKELVAQQFTAFDPDIKITSSKGKSFFGNDERITQIKALPAIEVASTAIEDKAMIEYDGRQVMVILKGVESNFDSLTEIDRALIGRGEFLLNDNYFEYAIPGAGLISALNCGIYFVDPLEVYAPKRNRKVNMTNPAANFKKEELHASGLIFSLNQPKYDDNYILTSINFARKLFGRKENEVNSLEIRLTKNADIKKVKNEIKAILGNDFEVKDRYEQQEDVFRIMTIEKFISYIFLSFILLVACFNIIGSLSMLIIEKEKDVRTLRSLGADDNVISNIFIIEGLLVSLLGAVIGVVSGVALCFAQQEFGLLSFGAAAGEYIVDSYPVKIILSDILWTVVTVIIVGLLAVGLPTRYLTTNLLKKNRGSSASVK